MTCSMAHGVIFGYGVGKFGACLGVDVQARPVLCAPGGEWYGIDAVPHGAQALRFELSFLREDGSKPVFVPLVQQVPVLHERHGLAKSLGFVPRDADDANA